MKNKTDYWAEYEKKVAEWFASGDCNSAEKTKKTSTELAKSVTWAESLLPIIEYDFQNELHKEFAHMDKGLQECYAWYNTVWLKSYLNARTRKPVADSLRQARIEELEDELSRLTGIDYRDVRIRR